MLRNFLIALCVLALTLPAFGYEVRWEGDQSGDITIELQIDCYIQIQWQDVLITFNDGTTLDPVTGTYDFWSTQLMNVAYGLCPDDEPWGGKHSPDPWAGGDYYAGPGGRYYESADGAVIYIHSNNDFEMDVHVNGNLTGTLNSPFGQIPTWFTLCLAPFIINGSPLDDGSRIPGVNPYTNEIGCYADGPPGGGPMTPCPSGKAFPNQHAFPCDPPSQTWTLDIDAPAQGTMKFLCRIERHGMMDGGDLYTTWIDVDFHL
jgi:hypothetical protein